MAWHSEWGQMANGFVLTASVKVSLDRRDGKEFGRLRNCAFVRLLYESRGHKFSARFFRAVQGQVTSTSRHKAWNLRGTAYETFFDNCMIYRRGAQEKASV